jgi:hypothetical protein
VPVPVPVPVAVLELDDVVDCEGHRPKQQERLGLRQQKKIFPKLFENPLHVFCSNYVPPSIHEYVFLYVLHGLAMDPEYVQALAVPEAVPEALL